MNPPNSRQISSQKTEWTDGNPNNGYKYYSHSPPRDLSVGNDQHIRDPTQNSSLTSQTSSLASSFSMTTITPPSQISKTLDAHQHKIAMAAMPDLSSSVVSQKEWEIQWQQEQQANKQRLAANGKDSNSPHDQQPRPRSYEAPEIQNPRSLPIDYENIIAQSDIDRLFEDGISSSSFSGISPKISSQADDVMLDALLNSDDISKTVHTNNIGIAKGSPPEFASSSTQKTKRVQGVHEIEINNSNGTDNHPKIDGTYDCGISHAKVIKDKKQMRHTPSQINATTSDKAVRGGNIFKSFFNKKSSQKGAKDGLPIANAHPNRVGNMNQSNRRRRIHSSPALAHGGSLDSTRRGNVDIPIHDTQSERCRSRMNMESTLSSILKPDKAIRGGSNFLIGPRNTKRSSLPSPYTTESLESSAHKRYSLSAIVHGESSASSTSSSKSSREQKMKFTKIHNSKDSATAFLGDEKSGHGGNFFQTTFGDGNKNAAEKNSKFVVS